MESIQIEPITFAELPQLQQLAQQTFEDAFAWANSPENFQSYISWAFSLSKLSDELQQPYSEFYFAKWEGIPIGYLKLNFGPAQKTVQDNKSLEIERIYVLEKYHGKHVGQALMDKARSVAMENGMDYLWLGVWDKNFRAMRFYERNGFVVFDSHVFVLGDEEQVDVLMRLWLNPIDTPSTKK